MFSKFDTKFWLQHEYIDGDRMRFHTVYIVSDTIESAIKDAFGFTVRPASPMKYDVCSQQEGEAGHRYWLANVN